VEDNIKINLEAIELNKFVTEQEPLVGSCERGYETSAFIKT
jgi:hypothetical protein